MEIDPAQTLQFGKIKPDKTASEIDASKHMG